VARSRRAWTRIAIWGGALAASAAVLLWLAWFLDRYSKIASIATTFIGLAGMFIGLAGLMVAILQLRQPAAPVDDTSRLDRSAEAAPGADLAQLLTTHLRKTVERYEEQRQWQPHNWQQNILDFYIEPKGARAPPNGAAARAAAPQDMTSLLIPSLEAGRPCIVLADFGMGKSWLLQMLEFRLAQQALDSEGPQEPGRIPFLLNLRSFRAGGREHGQPLGRLLPGAGEPTPLLVQLRRAAWSKASEAQLPLHEAELLRRFERNQFVLLLDGLDEMAGSSRRSWEDILQPIGELATRTAKSSVIVTARRTLFEDVAQERRLGDLGFDVLYLWPWSATEIESYVAKAHTSGLLTDGEQDVLKAISSIHDLQDVTTRAMLTAMLVAQWPQIAEAGGRLALDTPSLYERYIETSLLDWQTGRTDQLDTSDMRVAMEEIAFMMLELDALEVTTRELDRYLSGKARELGVRRFSTIANSIARDIRVTSLLVRNHDQYAFCHVSVWEFFVARRLYRLLDLGDTSGFEVPRRNKQYKSIFDNFLMPMLDRGGKRDLLRTLFR